MSFCHILITVVSISSPSGDFDRIHGAAHCNFDREVECLASVKTLPTGASPKEGVQIVSSFCHGPLRDEKKEDLPSDPKSKGAV